ncbi:lactonase family protein [Agarilytica rhodophyticola]|uniref:lactonase family protein n=1 Tax=Agarilytica rhodophyticola TaxID=1737490 RepID=UPI000B343B58|nr:beta-propeller fold lactonase family protein [Agarilytica rhodophyticola]
MNGLKFFSLVLTALLLCSCNGSGGNSDDSSASDTPENQSDIIELLVFGRKAYVLQFDKRTLKFNEAVEVSDDSVGSYGILDSQNRIYAATAGVTSNKWVENEFLQISHQRGIGDNNGYISLSKNEDKLAVSSFATGNISLFSIDKESGAIKDDSVVISRSIESRAHWVQWGPSGNNIYAIYHGEGKITRHSYDVQKGQVDLISNVVFQEDSGAATRLRHMAFHPGKPNFVYIVAEGSNEIIFTEVSELNGQFIERQRISTLPSSFTDNNTAAHIQISKDGNNLYVSNRGHDSIAVFNIDANGELSLIEHETANINRPRFFLLLDDEKLLFTANQRGGSIVATSVGLAGELDILDVSSDVVLNGSRFIAKLP